MVSACGGRARALSLGLNGLGLCDRLAALEHAKLRSRMVSAGLIAWLRLSTQERVEKGRWMSGEERTLECFLSNSLIA
jgi:hypothetical protein